MKNIVEILLKTKGLPNEEEILAQTDNKIIRLN